MALTGDEKRIRALFSELALQDQTAAPAFVELWQNAASKKPAPVRGFSGPLVVVTAALLIVATSWAAWSWYRSTRSSYEQVVNSAPQIVSPPPLHVSPPALQQVTQQPKQLMAIVKPRPSRPNKRRLHQPEHPAITEAALLSSWQSPTKIFMQSPTAVNFSSLPQLNQSVKELKQFLPRNTELTKESNQ